MSTVESDLDVSGAAQDAEVPGTEITQARLTRVGRTPDDIAMAARDWATGQRFGTVTGYHGAPLAAPPLDPVRLARKAR